MKYCGLRLSERHAWVIGVALVLGGAGCGSTNRNPADRGEDVPGGVGGAGEQAQGGAPQLTVKDPGYIPLHRLTNEEYDNSTAALLGTSVRQGDRLPPDNGYEFRNNSAGQATISELHAERYLSASEELVQEVFKTPALKAQVLTCAAPSAGDADCARSIIEDFGRRAWRRPLQDSEVEWLVERYSDALVTLEKDHEGAIAHVLRIMLTSMKFLYFVEIDPDLRLAATEGRALNGYELAARLSYALWGSPPDQTLARLAESGSLLESDTLLSQTRRLLEDAQSRHFVKAFLGHYLRVDDLFNQVFDPQLYPIWTPELALAMTQESSAFLSTFVDGSRTWSQLLTVPLTGDAPGLGDIYAGDPPGFRQGLLNLPAFLTATSHSTRTSPVIRGTVVVQHLLCEAMTPPANVDIPELSNPVPPPRNPREALLQHSESDACAACHVWIDPIGLALENFDALGRYRTEWPDGGGLIDASGSFVAGGEGIPEPAPRFPFTTPQQLFSLLTADARISRCATRKLLGYVLRRTPRDEDEAFADQLGDEWASGDLRDLVDRLVQSELFRVRKLPEDAL
jgi:hypothetical protein